MIEIFSTNIKNQKEANIISGLLHLCFPNLRANIDLHDTDHVLRIESINGKLNINALVNYIRSLGYRIQWIK